MAINDVHALGHNLVHIAFNTVCAGITLAAETSYDMDLATFLNVKNYSLILESIIIVTEPSSASAHCISAPKTPSRTC